uniref:Xylanolytic transcriptional activator regulatory domain-containing protein n=1 Tax=Moniliophthora roreri TaxID=221103 RepID=A0A0W0FBI2_MONRR
MEKKKHGSQRTKISRSLHEIQTLVDSILSTSKPFVVPRDTQSVHQLLVDLAHYARSLEQGQIVSFSSTPRNTSSLPTDGATPDSMRSYAMQPRPAGPYMNLDLCRVEDDLDSLQERFNHLDLKHGTARHFGPSSSLVFTQSILSLKRRIKGSKQWISRKRPQFWHIFPWQIKKEEVLPDYIFPEEDLLTELIDLFFNKINLTFPMLHRSVFERCIADNLHRRNRHFGATVLALCAAASRYSDDHRVFDDPAEPLSAGWNLRVANVLSMYFVYCTTTPEACWILLGHGVRCAQDLGIHQRQPRNAKPTVESQLLNRAFWCLFVIDVLLFTALGRPRAIHPEEIDVPLPLEVDDEYWEIEDPDKAFKQPAGKLCKMSFWISFLKLAEIFGCTQWCSVRSSDMGTMWRERNIIDIDSQLNAWVDTIPDHLKWDPDRKDSLFFHQSAILYTLYYWIQIHVHRSFIVPMQVVSPFPSQVICTNAARSCCHVLEAQYQRDVIVHPVTLKAAFTSGIILYLNVETNKETQNTVELNKEINNCYKCYDCLGKSERRFQSAGYYRDILAEIFSDLPNHHQPQSETRATRHANNRPRFGTDVNFEPSETTARRGYQTSDPIQTSSGSSAFDLVSTVPAPMSLPIYNTDLQANPSAQDVFHTPGYPNLDAYNSNFDWTVLDASNPDLLTTSSSGTMEVQGSATMHRFMDEYILGL